jgi:hypothetical protein
MEIGTDLSFEIARVIMKEIEKAIMTEILMVMEK